MKLPHDLRLLPHDINGCPWKCRLCGGLFRRHTNQPSCNVEGQEFDLIGLNLHSTYDPADNGNQGS